MLARGEQRNLFLQLTKASGSRWKSIAFILLLWKLLRWPQVHVYQFWTVAARICILSTSHSLNFQRVQQVSGVLVWFVPEAALVAIVPVQLSGTWYMYFLAPTGLFFKMFNWTFIWFTCLIYCWVNKQEQHPWCQGDMFFNTLLLFAAAMNSKSRLVTTIVLTRVSKSWVVVTKGTLPSACVWRDCCVALVCSGWQVFIPVAKCTTRNTHTHTCMHAHPYFEIKKRRKRTEKRTNVSVQDRYEAKLKATNWSTSQWKQTIIIFCSDLFISGVYERCWQVILDLVPFAMPQEFGLDVQSKVNFWHQHEWIQYAGVYFWGTRA